MLLNDRNKPDSWDGLGNLWTPSFKIPRCFPGLKPWQLVYNSKVVRMILKGRNKFEFHNNFMQKFAKHISKAKKNR